MTNRFFDENVLRSLRESWALGWPMILIMFFQFLIGFTDVFVAGYLGTDVLAAVGYVGQLYWTLMILANGLNVGTVSMVSQAYGAKSCEGVGTIGANSLLVGICVAGAITLFSQLFPDVIVKLAGMPPEIQTIAENFLRIFSLVLIPTYVMILSSGVLRSSGRVRITMVNSFVASSVNVALDLVLAFGYGPIPAMGYIGIAWATALSTTLGMCLNLLFVMRGAYAISFGAIFRPLTPCLRNLLKLGIPTVLQQTSWNVGTLVVYHLVGNIRSGEITALAAMTAGVRVEAVIFLPIFALNMAAAVLTGNRIGAGDIVGAQRGARVAAWLCLFIILVPAALIFAFAPEVASWLAHDQPVLEEMVRYLRINMLGTPFLAVGITLAGAIQGAGDTYGSMKIIVTGMWLLRIPFILATIYVFGVGPAGVWWAMTCSMVFMCGLFIKRFSRGEWTTASRDKTQNKLLWEACLPGEGLVETHSGNKEDREP
jgi:MATE family multidrug resistance protein